MALFPCPECGREISSRAAACPQCGCPVELSAHMASLPPGVGEPSVLTDTDDFLSLKHDDLSQLPEIVRSRANSVLKLKIGISARELVTDDTLKPLVGFTALQSLDLHSCPRLTDAVFEHVALIGTLVKLNMKYTNVSGTGFYHLLYMPDLQEVDLKFCPNLHPRHVPTLTGIMSLRRVGLPTEDYNSLFTFDVRKQLKRQFPSECSVG